MKSTPTLALPFRVLYNHADLSAFRPSTFSTPTRKYIATSTSPRDNDTSHSWMSDVNTFPELDSQIRFGPTYKHEYSTREAYGANITGWGPNDPLNATWWHLVTERAWGHYEIEHSLTILVSCAEMEQNPSLVQQFNTFQGKTSVRTQPCTGDCIPAKICYIRSGSVPLALSNCIPNFGSVQGG